MNDLITPEWLALDHRPFQEFGTSTLWSSKPLPNPTPADALAITRSLRVEVSVSLEWRCALRINGVLPATCFPGRDWRPADGEVRLEN